MTNKITDPENATTEQLLAQIEQARTKLVADITAWKADQTQSHFVVQQSRLEYETIAFQFARHMQELWDAGYRLRKDGD